jgi:RNA polymerase sigma factor (sigma-70 family)
MFLSEGLSGEYRPYEGYMSGRKPVAWSDMPYINLLKLYRAHLDGDESSLKKFTEVAHRILVHYLDRMFRYYVTLEDIEDSVNRAISGLVTRPPEYTFKTSKHILNYLKVAARHNIAKIITKNNENDRRNTEYFNLRGEEAPQAEEELMPLDELLKKYEEYYVEVAKTQKMPPMARSLKILKRRAAGQSLEEIGKDLELTKERVRQIEAKGIAALRRFIAAKNI